MEYVSIHPNAHDVWQRHAFPSRFAQTRLHLRRVYGSCSLRHWPASQKVVQKQTAHDVSKPRQHNSNPPQTAEFSDIPIAGQHRAAPFVSYMGMDPLHSEWASQSGERINMKFWLMLPQKVSKYISWVS